MRLGALIEVRPTDDDGRTMPEHGRAAAGAGAELANVLRCALDLPDQIKRLRGSWAGGVGRHANMTILQLES